LRGGPATPRWHRPDRRALAAAFAAAALAGCSSDVDKVGEGVARQQLAAQYLVADVGRENCEASRRLSRSGSVREEATEDRCRAAAAAQEELSRLEQAYLKACRACATPERCEAALGRLRQSRGRSDERACP